MSKNEGALHALRVRECEKCTKSVLQITLDSTKFLLFLLHLQRLESAQLR